MSRITFVVNTTGLTGGIRVVFEYANRLAARGHNVEILHYLNVSTGKLADRHGVKAILKKAKHIAQPGVDWFDLKVPVRRYLPGERFPDADVVVATANETAEWVARLPERCGSKFYFIQHLETWSRDPSAVTATWKLPLKKIVIASWLEEVASGMGETVVACIPNGVNFEEFHCTNKRWNQPPRVLMMTHNLEWKGTGDGLAALAYLRNQGYHFEVTLFGTHRPQMDLPGEAIFVLNPQRETLREMYCAHDIFISPSWAEGYQLPPMEAMACGCAVVATNVGGIPDYAIPGETALVVEPKQPEKLAASIGVLLQDPDRLQTIGRAGQEHIQAFDWNNSVVRMERALLDHA